MQNSWAGYSTALRFLLVASLLLLIGFSAAWASNPARATHLCSSTGSPAGPFTTVAYEASLWNEVYGASLTAAGLNQLFPGDPYFGLPPLEQGPRTQRTVAPASYIPPSILKAIAWIESSWIQAWYDVPYGSVGPALISHDCGYGIMQVTTGMQNTTGLPTSEQAMTASHFAYNIARGAYILADKWNSAPEFRPVVGNSDPRIIEDWYYAIWSYNGFAFKNHPLNPAYSQWPRISYSCGQFGDGFSHDRSQFPYQELVAGCMAHPPLLANAPLWQPQEVTLPDLSAQQIFEAMSVSNFLFNESAMDVPHPEITHTDPTQLTLNRSAIVGAPLMSVAPAPISLEVFKDTADGVPMTSSSVSPPIAVSNSGTGLLAWTAAPSAPWIDVIAPQGIALGSDLGGLASSFRIGAKVDNVEPGRYTGTVLLLAPYTNSAPVLVSINLVVYDRVFVPGILKD